MQSSWSRAASTCRATLQPRKCMARAFFNEQIKQVMDDWRRSVGSEDAALFAAFAKRVEKFREFHRELVRRGVEIGPEAGREWGDNDANRSVRKALNDD